MGTTALNPDVVVADIPKNARTTLRVQLRVWKGHNLLDLRLYAPGLTGELRPTPEGVAINVERLPEIAKALVEAEAEARRRGLITSDGLGSP